MSCVHVMWYTCHVPNNKINQSKPNTCTCTHVCTLIRNKIKYINQWYINEIIHIFTLTL